MLTKVEVAGGNAVNGIGNAAVSALTTMALKTLLSEKNLSQPAQSAITSFQSHFLSEPYASSFISPLIRSGFYVGKEPFKKTETISYLGNKIEINHRRLSILTNSNLKEAATHLWDLHCEVAMHMIHRQDATFERSDTDHSYVLMYLQESIAAAFDELVNKADLTDEDIRKLQTDINKGIVEPFHNYIQSTQPRQSNGARRTALSHQLRISMEKTVHSLERFVTEKPLRTSINALQHKAQSFNNVLKQLLLAIVLVPRNDAGKQQDETWVLQRKMMLSKAIESEPSVMLSCLLKSEVSSIGYQGKSGVLYKNPLAARVAELVQSPAQTRDQLYFNFLLDILNPKAEQLDFTQIAEQFDRHLNELPVSQTFILNDILRSGVSEGDFIHNSVSLYRQTYELARFMAALQRFLQLVGKLGLYNNHTLHTQLTALIQTSLASLEGSLHHFKMHIKEGAEARVGGWLSPIDELFQYLKKEGAHIIKEMRSFQTHFAKIIDHSAMQMEFHKSKQELLQAALGLGHASNIAPDQMNEIQKKIGHMEFTDFTRSHSDGVDVNERMRSILCITTDMGRRLEEAKAEVEKFKLQCEMTTQELARVQQLMCENEDLFRKGQDSLIKSKEQVEDSTKRAGIMLGEIDQIIESFGQKIIGQIKNLDIETQKDVEEANRLIASSSNAMIASCSGSLSEQMTFLSGIKSKLEERQRSYQNMVQTVSVFQKEYTAKRGQMTLVLTNIEEATKDIERTVTQLMAKISALTEIICNLRLTLEKKDKQLAEQKQRLDELEAQLSALKYNDNHSSISPTNVTLYNHSFCFEDKEQSNPYFKRSSLSIFTKGEGKCKLPLLTFADKIAKPIELYRYAIQEKRFVRNRQRKVIKYAIWSELNNIVFQKTSEPQGKIETHEDLILAAIQLTKARRFTMKGFNDVYQFNDIVAKLSDAEIYVEFIAGSDTSNALKELEPAFNLYLQNRSLQIAIGLSNPHIEPLPSNN